MLVFGMSEQQSQPAHDSETSLESGTRTRLDFPLRPASETLTLLSVEAIEFVAGAKEHWIRGSRLVSDPSSGCFRSEFVPCRVSAALDAWSRELMDDDDRTYILAGIKDGFRLVDDDNYGPATCMSNYRSTTVHNRKLVENRIREEIAAGNYVVTSVKPLACSALGAIPKGLLDIRLIHDLSRPDGGVNRLASDTSVSFTTVDKATELIVTGSHLAKIDLKSAYRSIPIRVQDYNLTGLQWRFEGDKYPTYLFDSKLPFGAAKSCQIFQRLTDSIVRMMRRKGFYMLGYIDDMLCVGSDLCNCQDAYDTLIDLIVSLGLVVNESKCCGPVEVITFLGVKINCVTRKLSLPDVKLAEFRVLVDAWSKRRRVTKHELQVFLGKLNWAARVVRGGRTFVRRLIDLLPRAKAANHHIRLTPEAKEDISWWKDGLVNFHGCCNFVCDVPLPAFMFSCDACLSGGGAHFGEDWHFWLWHVDFPEIEDSHINVLELFTVLLSLIKWGEELSGSHVIIRSDNMVTVSALNKSTSRGPEIMPLVRQIFWLCVKHGIVITGQFIPGKVNILADRISRLEELESAKEARYILANFVCDRWVACVGHMSIGAFVCLQDRWTKGLTLC